MSFVYHVYGMHMNSLHVLCDMTFFFVHPYHFPVYYAFPCLLRKYAGLTFTQKIIPFPITSPLWNLICIQEKSPLYIPTGEEPNVYYPNVHI